MQRGELRRTERCFGRHEIFSEKIGVLDHRALERLKNHAALFQIIGDDVTFDQLIVRENHATGYFVETARVFQDIFAVVFRKWTRNFECATDREDRHWRNARADLCVSDAESIRISSRPPAVVRETNQASHRDSTRPERIPRGL